MENGINANQTLNTYKRICDLKVSIKNADDTINNLKQKIIQNKISTKDKKVNDLLLEPKEISNPTQNIELYINGVVIPQIRVQKPKNERKFEPQRKDLSSKEVRKAKLNNELNLIKNRVAPKETILIPSFEAFYHNFVVLMKIKLNYLLHISCHLINKKHIFFLKDLCSSTLSTNAYCTFVSHGF